MDNKQFKKILKESLSTGASSLFEEEEETSEETVTDEEDSSNLTEMAKQLLALIDISKNDLETIKASNKLDDDSFAKAMAYYYVARYYDDQENFSMSLNTPRDFDKSINFVLQEIEKAAENVVCFFDEVVRWSMKSKMYANPQSFVEKLQQKTDEETFRAIASKLSDNHKSKFQISSSNSSLLKKLIAALPKDFDLSMCGTSKARVPQESKKLRTKKQQPMSLESLKVIIKKTDARDYATKIITALKQDMEDLRVRVNEAREKTPLLTNTIKVLQSIPDKEIQKAALKSILDFFKVNKLQIDDKTKSDLIKSDILVIQKKAKQKKQQPGEEKQGEKEASEEGEAEEGEESENNDSSSIEESEVCKQILDSLKKEDPKLYDSMKDDDTIRGAVANLANDLSFTTDAVALSALTAAVAIPPAAPFLAPLAAGLSGTGRASAGVAVAMDILLGNPKDALIDAIGLIPWGKWVGKGMGATSKALAKAGQKASSESAQKFLQAAAKSAGTASKSAGNVGEKLAAELLQKAPALGEEGAKRASKAIMNGVTMRIQTKLQGGGYGKDAPDPSKFKDPKEYKQALKNWQNAKKEAIEKEYAGCFKKDNSAAKNRAINFLEAANDYVDDFPDAFEAVVGKGVDAVIWAKEFIFGDDDEDEYPSPEKGGPVDFTARENLNLNDQRYNMLLERFNIK